jgi:hypothetical protein
MKRKREREIIIVLWIFFDTGNSKRQSFSHVSRSIKEKTKRCGVQEEKLTEKMRFFSQLFDDVNSKKKLRKS